MKMRVIFYAGVDPAIFRASNKITTAVVPAQVEQGFQIACDLPAERYMGLRCVPPDDAASQRSLNDVLSSVAYC